MFQRFAAGCTIASVAIALGALVVVLTPALTLQRIDPLTIIWCFVPLWAFGRCFCPQYGHLSASRSGERSWD